jgi:hypothetical protein
VEVGKGTLTVGGVGTLVVGSVGTLIAGTVGVLTVGTSGTLTDGTSTTPATGVLGTVRPAADTPADRRSAGARRAMTAGETAGVAGTTAWAVA